MVLVIMFGENSPYFCVPLNLAMFPLTIHNGIDWYTDCASLPVDSLTF